MMDRARGAVVMLSVLASQCLLPPHDCRAADSVFSVHPTNHRCFVYRGKAMKILTSAEHYGAVINGDFDYGIYLKEMQRTGQNATRVFTFYRERWGRQVRNTLAPTPEGSVLPWPRAAGRGNGADGLGKFDLSRWNAAYFSRLKDYVRACGKHGVVCEIVLFCNPYGKGTWAWFPCQEANNINGVGGDCPDYRQFMTLEAPTIVAFQERFVRKIVRELNPFDNVYFEICNEPYGRTFPKAWREKGNAWHARIAQIVRQAEKDLPKRHAIAANVTSGETAITSNRDIDIINYHYPSVRTWYFLRRLDPLRKAIVFDENYTGIVGSKPAERYAINRSEAWLTLLSGCAGFSSLDWTFTAADEAGCGRTPLLDGRRIDGRPLRKWLSVFRKLLATYDMAALVPAAGVLPARVAGCGYAATTDGRGRYILYFADERLYRVEPCPPRALTVRLTLPAGRYTVRTFDPRSGKTTPRPSLRSAGTVSVEIPAFREDVAVLLERSRR